MLKKNLLNSISKTLINIAPEIANKTACILFWGETDCPVCLNEENK